MIIHSKKSLLLSVAALSVFLLSSCRNHSAPAEEETVVKTPVTIIPVSIKQVASSVSLPATATFMNKSIVRATTSGTIDKILITQGQVVSSDQLLFTIRTREAMAVSNKMEGDTSLGFKGLINIYCHRDGLINSISYQKGDFVQEGDELAAISEQNSLVFILDVPVELEKYIGSNRNCTISLPDSRKIRGTITGKLPEMNMESQTIRYVVKPSTIDRISGNLIASIELVKAVSNNAVVVPREAVLGNETQTSFWVMKLINDSTAVKVPISKGFENNDEVEIASPVFSKDERILLTGGYGLPDTARVTIIQK
jgi:biotin carboxyl carrier protein